MNDMLGDNVQLDSQIVDFVYMCGYYDPTTNMETTDIPEAELLYDAIVNKKSVAYHNISSKLIVNVLVSTNG